MMTSFKAWTTKTLTRFSLWLANAFGFGIDSDQPTATGNTWNAETLANFGLKMSQGYGLGL
jgi:hypothetical protein